MNVTMFRTSPDTGKSIFAGDLPMLQRTGLKSVQDRVERQQKAQDQIAFWEKQKENLKNMECDTPEAIAAKLDRFHAYESEIAAVKTQYNMEQIWHTMDEAKELSEKIAEEAEKFEPKTAEERLEDMAEEALGTDENKGELTESMEEMQEEMAELTEDLSRTMEEVTESAEETYDSLPEASMEAVEAAAEAEMPTGSADKLMKKIAAADWNAIRAEGRTESGGRFDFSI